MNLLSTIQIPKKFQKKQGEETVPPINNLENLTVMNALHFACPWPEFVADFKDRVHLKKYLAIKCGWRETFLETTQSDR